MTWAFVGVGAAGFEPAASSSRRARHTGPTASLRCARLLSVTVRGRTAGMRAHRQAWRSVRANGDTKIRKSRRPLALPGRCGQVLRVQPERQKVARAQAGKRWRRDLALVSTRAQRTAYDAAGMRRAVREVVKAAGPDAQSWTLGELRHSFVSLLSDGGCRLRKSPGWPVQRLVGHGGDLPKAIRPLVQNGAVAIDGLFPRCGVVTQFVTQNKVSPHLPITQMGADLESGWRDSNPRPLRPERSALPSCATPRWSDLLADSLSDPRERVGPRVS